jgi:hypothetical protein
MYFTHDAGKCLVISKETPENTCICDQRLTLSVTVS